MAKTAQPDPTDLDQIAFRLRTLLKALKPRGITSGVELCRLTGITPQAWANYVAAVSRPQLDQAMKLCRQFGLTLDWIYRGDPQGLPLELGKEIARLERSAPIPPPSGGAKAARKHS